jgi:DNA-binding NtrC family response regulator
VEDKILLVDDDDLVLACFQRLLSPHFSLDVALGPLEALTAISTHGPYAVVVSDMRMPGLNGLQLLTRVKEMSPNTIGIILSGDLNSLDTVDCDLVFRAIEKPCPFDQLIDIIREAITCHHQLSPTLP